MSAASALRLAVSAMSFSRFIWYMPSMNEVVASAVTGGEAGIAIPGVAGGLLSGVSA
jgi:hypothetical protein